MIDLRAAVPIDYAPLVESVRKTAKVVLVSEEVERGSVMQSVAANLTQLCFDDLDAPPAVVGARNWITPAAELDIDVLSSAVLGARRHTRALASFARLPTGHDPYQGRADEARSPGDLEALSSTPS